MVRKPEWVMVSSTILPSRFTTVRTEYKAGRSSDHISGDATARANLATDSFNGSTVILVRPLFTTWPDGAMSVDSTSTSAEALSLL